MTTPTETAPNEQTQSIWRRSLNWLIAFEQSVTYDPLTNANDRVNNLNREVSILKSKLADVENNSRGGAQ